MWLYTIIIIILLISITSLIIGSFALSRDSNSKTVVINTNKETRDDLETLKNQNIFIEKQITKINQLLIQSGSEIVNISIKQAEKDGMISESGIPSEDPYGSPGWFFKNITDENKNFNFYFLPNQEKLTLIKDIIYIYAIVKFYNSESLPFFNLYSKLAPDNNGSSWYCSRWTYEINTPIVNNQTYLMFCGQDPQNIKSDLLRIETILTDVNGPTSNEETILTANLMSNNITSTELTVLEMGYKIENGESINFVLKA